MDASCGCIDTEYRHQEISLCHPIFRILVSNAACSRCSGVSWCLDGHAANDVKSLLQVRTYEFTGLPISQQVVLRRQHILKSDVRAGELRHYNTKAMYAAPDAILAHCQRDSYVC